MHSIEEVDMIVAKMDVLANKLQQYERINTQKVVQSLESHMTCEVYGESGHLGNHCPKTHEDLNFLNNDNGFANQIKDGVSAPILKETLLICFPVLIFLVITTMGIRV